MKNLKALSFTLLVIYFLLFYAFENIPIEVHIIIAVTIFSMFTFTGIKALQKGEISSKQLIMYFAITTLIVASAIFYINTT